MTIDPAILNNFATLQHSLAADAARMADEIADFQPDLIIALAHSGWLPLLAAQTWWQTTGRGAFPPATRLNIGLEKVNQYDDIWGDADMDLWPMDQSSPVYLGHLWHWIAGRLDWAAQLQQVVTAVLSHNTPQRIMVIDEIIREGGTYFLTTGLLAAVYPAAAIRFVAGHLLHWGQTATPYWLAHHAPNLLNTFSRLTSVIQASDWVDSIHWQSRLRCVAAGTEDTDPTSLLVRPVTAAGPTIQALSAYLPGEQWLTVSTWLHNHLLDHVKQQAAVGMPPDGPQLTVRDGWPWQPQVLSTLWAQGSLSRKELTVLAAAASDADTAADFVAGLIRGGEIVARGWGRWTRYWPSPKFYPELTERDDPANNAYEVIPGQVWAGPCAFATTYRHVGLAWLQEQQIDAVVDLIGQTAVIDREVAAYNESRTLSLRIYSLPCKTGEVPQMAALATAVAWIEQQVDEGRRVYIQSKIGNGRAAVVAAALLIGRGTDSRAAWKQLQARWRSTTWGQSLRLPGSERQRRAIFELGKPQ